jgi:hypothetical protein
MAKAGPGRAPRLQRSYGRITQKPLWRYEGSDCWSGSEEQARQVWLSVFKPFFPEEARMLQATRVKAEDLLS